MVGGGGVATMTAIILAVVLLTPASSSASQSGQPSQVSKSMQVQIDFATASDNQIEAEANRLVAAVQAQQALVKQANDAAAAAKASLAQATASIADLQERTAAARSQLVSRAVNSYMNGGAVSSFSLLLRSGALQEEVRLEEYLTNAQSNLTGAAESLTSAQRDQVNAKKQLADAQKAVTTKVSAAAKQTVTLTAAERSNDEAHAALQHRISALLTESPDLAALDGQVRSLLSQQDAAATEALAALPPLGPGGEMIPGSEESAFGLIWPVHGPVTSEFGPRWGGFHPGLDIAPPYGTPIMAAKDGVVVFAGPDAGYGNFVIIDHGNGLATAYAHQSRIATTKGAIVRQGQIIGYEGSTGDSTGPHVHFEVRINGVVENPRNYESGPP
jgi:murein DD-endopeptidase MepM/ murein hydrolase activator NlpD